MLDLVGPDRGYTFFQNKSFAQEVDLNGLNLEPDKYRILKDFSGKSTNIETTLAVEFLIIK